jgi:hypothetical protein
MCGACSNGRNLIIPVVKKFSTKDNAKIQAALRENLRQMKVKNVKLYRPK